MKTNRFNGCTYTMTQSGWERTTFSDKCLTESDRREIANAEKQKAEAGRLRVKHKAEYDAGKQRIISSLIDNSKISQGYIDDVAKVELYNQTKCVITGLKIGISGRIYSGGPSAFSDSSTDIWPGTTGAYDFKLFENYDPLSEWTIEDVEYATPIDGEANFREGDPSCLSS